MVCRLRKALIAVLAVMLMVLVSVSCASSDDVERYDAWPDQEEPPQDASRYGYRLIGFRLLLGYGLSTGRRVKPQKQTEPIGGACETFFYKKNPEKFPPFFPLLSLQTRMYPRIK